MAKFIEDMCIFMKNNGNVIFRNINLNSNEKEDYYMSSLDNEEYVDYNNIYVDNSWIRFKFYKKYYYYSDSGSDGKTYKFLEWRKTKDNTWDWYITENINESKLINIINHVKIEDKNTLTLNKEEIINKIEIIINKFSLIDGEHDLLINNIKDCINDYVNISKTS